MEPLCWQADVYGVVAVMGKLTAPRRVVANRSTVKFQLRPPRLY